METIEENPIAALQDGPAPIQEDGPVPIQEDDAWIKALPRKRRGRPRKSESQNSESKIEESKIEESKIEESKIEESKVIKMNETTARALGEKMAKVYINLLAAISPDFYPKEKNEIEAGLDLVKQSGQFCVDKDIPDLPPGWALAFSAFNYTATIAMAERNRPKIKSFGSMLISNAFWDKFKFWKKK